MSTTISNLNIVNSIDVNQNLSCPGIPTAPGAPAPVIPAGYSFLVINNTTGKIYKYTP